ncbi:MAG: hypothetical protein AAGB22_08135, partial [Bacteroidota bacterium]
MPTTATRSNWMASHADALKQLPLNAITLPGTHDSGTYAYKGMEMPAKQTIKDILGFITKIFGVKLPITMALDVVWKVLLEQTITQQRTITEQLEDGIRYLDIRTAQDAGQLYIVHGVMPHCDKKVIGTGTGNDQGVVQDVAAFLADHPQEIVLLDFQEFQHLDKGSYARLLSQVLDHLGPYLLGPKLANGQATFEATLEAIWADQPDRGRAIVLFDRSEAEKIEGTKLWNDQLLWDRSQSVFSPWGNTASTERLENFLLMQQPDALMTKGYFNILQG